MAYCCRPVRQGRPPPVAAASAADAVPCTHIATHGRAQVVGEVYRRNGAPHIVDPLLRLLPSLGLWREYGWVQASVEPLALQALEVGVGHSRRKEWEYYGSLKAARWCACRGVGRRRHARSVGNRPCAMCCAAPNHSPSPRLPACPRQAAPYYASRIITAKWLNVGPPSHNYWNAPWNLGAYGADHVTNAAIQKFFIIVNKAQDALYYYLVSGLLYAACRSRKPLQLVPLRQLSGSAWGGTAREGVARQGRAGSISTAPQCAAHSALRRSWAAPLPLPHTRVYTGMRTSNNPIVGRCSLLLFAVCGR